MFRPKQVKALADSKIWLSYEDGTEGTIDLGHLVGKGVFASLADPDEFAKVRISEAGAIAWNDEQELCPDALYLQLSGQRPEDAFPSLRNTADA